MEYITLSWIDYLLFILIIFLSVAVGIYFGCFGKQETMTDYLLGGRNMSVFPVSMSLVASTLSGITLMGIPAEIYIYGTQYMVMGLSLIIMTFAANYIYLPVYYNLRLTNSYEYLELRFDKSVKLFASTLYILSNLLFMPVVIYAPSLAFNQVTGINIYVSALAMSLICIFYTSIGGLKAIVWTDTLQFSITLCTLVAVFIMGTISVNGFGNIWNKAVESGRIEFFNMNPDPTERNTFWTVFIGNYFIWISVMGIGAPAIQRFLSLPSFKKAQLSLLIFTVFTIITKFVCCFSGLIIYAKFFDCDPLSAGFMKKADQIVPFYVLQVAKELPGLSGIFIAGLFSTALSTLSTFLNTLCGITYMDFIAPFFKNEEKANFIMKILTVIFGLLCVAMIFLIERMGTIMELLLTLTGVTAGPKLGIITMGMLVPFANKKGALIGGISGFLFVSMILINTQMHLWNGDIKYVRKELNTYGCNLTQLSTTLADINNSSSTTNIPHLKDKDIFWLFRISFYYYYFVGTSTSVIVGLIVSWITHNPQDDVTDVKLVSPCIQRFLNKSNLKEVQETVDYDLNACKVEEKHVGAEMEILLKSKENT